MQNFSQQKAAARQLCNNTHWRSTCAFTFNLKQSCQDSRGYAHYLTEATAKKAFSQFMRSLNRHVYKSAYKRGYKRLRTIAIIEKSADGRWHYHVAIEPPAHIPNIEFCMLAMQLWQSSPSGYGHGEFEPNADIGWIEYCLKARGKSGHEHYFDCIDTEAFFNAAS